MEPAREELAAAIENTVFNEPLCPVYQNVPTTAITAPTRIKENLIAQLTAPVKWTQSVQRMVNDGALKFIEVGPGKALQGMIKKIDATIETQSATI
jgi:[acyl-carrier-protein] S-malonyltransferase